MSANNYPTIMGITANHWTHRTIEQLKERGMRDKDIELLKSQLAEHDLEIGQDLKEAEPATVEGEAQTVEASPAATTAPLEAPAEASSSRRTKAKTEPPAEENPAV